MGSFKMEGWLITLYRPWTYISYIFLCSSFLNCLLQTLTCYLSLFRKENLLEKETADVCWECFLVWCNPKEKFFLIFAKFNFNKFIFRRLWFGFFFPWDIKILGCCPVVTSLLPHEEKVPWLALWLVGCLVKSFGHPSAWGRCFTTSTDLTPHLFQMGWLKLNLILLLNQWDWLREMNAGGSCNHWRCSSFFGFLRPNLSPRGYRNGCFLVTLSSLIVRRP